MSSKFYTLLMFSFIIGNTLYKVYILLIILKVVFVNTLGMIIPCNFHQVLDKQGYSNLQFHALE
jgi:hypothetical protein